VPVVASVLSRLSARCEGLSANDLLFPARGGGYLKRSSYDSTGWFNRAVERARVQTITPRDLRHAAPSLAVSSGANVLAVSRMLGHKDPSVTLRIYAGLFDSDLDAVAVNLDAKIADSVQSACRPTPQARENRCLAATMRLPAQCPRGDLATCDTGCDLAIEAVTHRTLAPAVVTVVVRSVGHPLARHSACVAGRPCMARPAITLRALWHQPE
jgi:hypothetical protein